VSDRRPLTECDLQVHLTRTAELLEKHIASRLPAAIRNHVPIDDVIQSVWESCFESFPQATIWDDRALAGWVRSITNCRIVDAVRDFGRRGVKDGLIPEFARDASSMQPLLAAIAAEQETPSHAASSKEAIASLHVAIASLPRERQKVIWMRHLEGRSHAEIAQRLGKPLSAVNSLLYNAMRQLRREMGDASRYFSDMHSLTHDEQDDGAPGKPQWTHGESVDAEAQQSR
jgi:RNA polymerase sigma factor (sigma-70 family)